MWQFAPTCSCPRPNSRWHFHCLVFPSFACISLSLTTLSASKSSSPLCLAFSLPPSLSSFLTSYLSSAENAQSPVRIVESCLTPVLVSHIHLQGSNPWAHRGVVMWLHTYQKRYAPPPPPAAGRRGGMHHRKEETKEEEESSTFQHCQRSLCSPPTSLCLSTLCTANKSWKEKAWTADKKKKIYFLTLRIHSYRVWVPSV